jgi:hypothetical protein
VPLSAWFSQSTSTDSEQRKHALSAVSFGFDELYSSGNAVVSQYGEPVSGLHGMSYAGPRFEYKLRILPLG